MRAATSTFTAKNEQSCVKQEPEKSESDDGINARAGSYTSVDRNAPNRGTTGSWDRSVRQN